MGVFEGRGARAVARGGELEARAEAAERGVALSERRLLEKTPRGVELLSLHRSPPPFDLERQATFLDALCDVPNVARAARLAGITAYQARRLMQDDSAFGAACEMAKEIAIGVAEEAAFHRAIQGVQDPIVFQGVKVEGIDRRKFSDSLLSQILENNEPRYLRKQAIKEERHVKVNWRDLMDAIRDSGQQTLKHYTDKTSF